MAAGVAVVLGDAQWVGAVRDGRLGEGGLHLQGLVHQINSVRWGVCAAERLIGVAVVVGVD